VFGVEEPAVTCDICKKDDGEADTVLTNAETGLQYYVHGKCLADLKAKVTILKKQRERSQRSARERRAETKKKRDALNATFLTPQQAIAARKKAKNAAKKAPV
jgi:hypothetical protein